MKILVEEKDNTKTTLSTYAIEDADGNHAVIARLIRRNIKQETGRGVVHRNLNICSRLNPIRFYLEQHGDHITAFALKPYMHGLVLNRFGNPVQDDKGTILEEDS